VVSPPSPSIARPLHARDPIGVDLEQSLYALDSTTIDLCLSLFPWGEVSPAQGRRQDAHLAGLARQHSHPFDAVNNNAFLHAEFFNNAASSIYHALQANITKRMSHGLAIEAAYPGLRLLVKESAKPEMVARNTPGAVSEMQILSAARYTICNRGCSIEEKSFGI
jgi:hypothetical protein